jgi:hypothetical protein
MNRFHITAADLDKMTEIARVSSYAPDKKAWTELAIYQRHAHTRPWVAVVEGKSGVLDMSDRFKAMAAGTIERAMNWFDGSDLRDRLAEKVEATYASNQPQFDADAALTKYIPEMFPGDEIKMTGADGVTDSTSRIPIMKPGEEIIITKFPADKFSVQDPSAKHQAQFTIREVGCSADSLYDVLKWLYPDSASDSARSQLLERDFGMPARTTRRALAVECGDAAGELGAWVNMFMVAMRFFDRELWMAGQATIANVES